MNIRARVRSLENRPEGKCAFCRGSGWSKVIVWTEGDSPPEPEGCPQCGRIAKHIKVIDLREAQASPCR